MKSHNVSLLLVALALAAQVPDRHALRLSMQDYATCLATSTPLYTILAVIWVIASFFKSPALHLIFGGLFMARAILLVMKRIPCTRYLDGSQLEVFVINEVSVVIYYAILTFMHFRQIVMNFMRFICRGGNPDAFVAIEVDTRMRNLFADKFASLNQ